MDLKFKDFIKIASNSPSQIKNQKSYLNGHATRLYETYLLLNKLTKPNSEVLSIGAGKAFTEYVLSKKKPLKLTIFDFPEVITNNKDQFKESNFSTIEGNFLTDFKKIGNKKFDVLLFCEIIEHIPVSPKKQLEIIKSYLKPNGFLIISTPNVANIYNIRRLIYSKNIFSSAEKLFVNPSQKNDFHCHRREYTMSEILRYCNDCDLEIFSKDYILQEPLNRTFFSFLLNIFLKLFKKYRPFLLISARKP